VIKKKLEQVLQLADEVECIFLRHFAGNDRKVAMKYLKPQQPRNTHMVTFLVGEYLRKSNFTP
jgi:xenotropic and polytropic retrovirus receptor 1